MAECKECGIDLTYVNSMPNQRCNKCHGNWLKSSIQKDTSENTKERPLAAASVTHQAPVTDPMLYLKEQQRLEEKNRLSKQELASVLLTTAHTTATPLQYAHQGEDNSLLVQNVMLYKPGPTHCRVDLVLDGFCCCLDFVVEVIRSHHDEIKEQASATSGGFCFSCSKLINRCPHS